MKQTIAAEGRPGWLILMRVVWCMVAFLAVAVVVTSILMAALSWHNLPVAVICSDCNGHAVVPAPGSVLVTVWWLDGYALYCDILCVIFALSYFVVAGVLFWRKSADRMALLAAFSLVLLAVTFCRKIPMLPHFWQMLVSHIVYLGLTCLFLFFCLFPMGRLLSWWSRGLTVVAVSYWGSYALFTGTFLNPFEHSRLLNVIGEYGLLLGLALVQIYRYKRILDPEMRRQTKWVVFGICSTVILYLAQQQFLNLVTPHSLQLLPQIISTTLFFISLLLIPLSIGVAILRSRLWNIDIIIHRTLVYGTLSACVVGLYILVVGGLGTLLQGQGNILVSLLATGLIAILFHPLRQRLQRAVSYLVYGKRSDPYQVLSQLSQRLETTLVPYATLSTIVETVAQAFKLPYAAITLKQGEYFVLGAVYGQVRQTEALLHIALTYQGEILGELILSSNAPGETFSARDQRLLEDLVRHAGAAVHSVCLSADIQRSREQLVMGREEERRRLRRDLHDGLGPQLASLILLLTTVRKKLRSDPDASERMLSEAMGYMQEAIKDIRCLVYTLRPPALDDLGLLAALQEDVRRYHASEVAFTLVTPDPLPLLPAAVEVACYRIAQEALTNVISHAHAHSCTLRLSIDNALNLEVTDDGMGLPIVRKNGIGLVSMRERAVELGGTCSIDTLPEGGTRVSACLPLRQGEQRVSQQRKETQHGAHSHFDC